METKNKANCIKRIDKVLIASAILIIGSLFISLELAYILTALLAATFIILILTCLPMPSFSKMQLLSHKFVVSLTILLILVAIIYPPYIITNKNHIPTETGFNFLFLLSELTKGNYAARVNTTLLMIEIAVILIVSALLLWVVPRDKLRR